jgi:hypothetical protein
MPQAEPPEGPDRDAFAAMIRGRLEQAGERAEICYDPERFRLSVEGEHANIANLGNLYEEYLQLGPEGRERLVRNYVRSWFAPRKALPADYEDVHPDLLPSVRPRAYIELNLLRMRLQGVKDAAWPYRPIGEHLAVCLVYDLPESLLQLQQRHLDDWGIDFDDALEHATVNLAQISAHHFEPVAPGVWRSPWQDNLDASRLALPGLIRAHDVQGDPVAFVPNRDTLLFTGSDDEQGLVKLAELAAEAFEHARAISGIAFRLVGDEWEPFLPDPEHPAYEPFRLLAVRSRGGDYSEQKELLTQLHAKEGEDLFVASFSAMRDKETGEVFSYCVWSDGVEALLPRTDCIVFYQGNGDEGRVLGSVAWDEAVEAFGDLMTPLEVYPERWRVSEFPSVERLDEVLGDE